MAKTATATKEKPAAKEVEDFKYGIEDVAEELGIKPASARVQLRKYNIKRAGKSYGWNSKTEVDEVVKKLKSDEKPAKKVEKKAAK